MGPKPNFQSQKIWVLSSPPCPHFNTLFKIWIPQISLIWPLLQHAKAKTTLSQQSSVPVYPVAWFLIPIDPQAAFHSLPTVTVTVTYASPARFSIFPVSSAHIPVHGAALTALRSCFWPCTSPHVTELQILEQDGYMPRGVQVSTYMISFKLCTAQTGKW